MAKLTTTDLTSLTNEASAVTSINSNFTSVETAMENTLSRDGTSPNTMSADIDLNGNDLLNVGAFTFSGFNSFLQNSDFSQGIVAHDGTSTIYGRTITGTANEIDVADGDGQSGNPTISLSPTLTYTGTLDVSGATVTYDSQVVTLNGSQVLTNKTLTAPVLNGTLSGSGILDEDNMASNSATAVPTQQSVKAYVDTLVSAEGGNWKNSVKIATTANITLSGEQTIDGVLTSGSRVLVKDQTAPAENGVYVSAAGAWSRAADADIWDELVSAAIFVEEGTTNQDTSYICTVDEGGTLETTSVTWTQFGVGGGGGLFRGNNGTVGSAPGDIFRINAALLTADEEIETGENASCTGPLSVDSGITLTVTGTLVII